jgi:hypothetical protein
VRIGGRKSVVFIGLREAPNLFYVKRLLVSPSTTEGKTTEIYTKVNHIQSVAYP